MRHKDEQHSDDEKTFSSHYATALKKFSKGGILTLALAGSLVATIVATTVNVPAKAAEAEGVTWSAGDVSWEIMSDGRCFTTQTVDVNTKSTADAVAISGAMANLPAKTDYPADSGIQDTHANVGSVVNTTNFPVVLHAYLAGDKCKAASAAQQTLFQTTGGGTMDKIQLAAAPAWLKGAIGAVVGAAVYVAVSAMVTAGITATGVLVGASAATVAAVTALAGCIGGATSTAVTLMLASSGSTWKSTLTNAAAGCVTGATIASLPIKTVGEKVGNAIRGALGFAPVATVGDAGVAAAASAGVELAGITEVTTTAADALVAVQ